MELYRPEEKLPSDNQYVLAYFPDRPWGDNDAKNNEHKWVVVKFVRGLSLSDREKLPPKSERRKTYRAADEYGNNKKPYYWDTFGPGSFFGQEAALWCELPAV